MMEELSGRTALVSGASSGIGLAVSRALVAAGAWVAMMARDDARLASAAAEAGGHAVAGDISSTASVHGVAAYVGELLGDAPDLIVNCAGAFSLGSLAETDPTDFDRQLAANLRGPFLLVRAFLPPMLQRRSGLVINVGSVAGRTAFAGNGAYAASKFGLRGMHEVLLQELRGTGVRATLLEPAATDTPLWDPLDPDSRGDLPDRAAMLRPEDVARAIVYVASQPRHVQIPVLGIESIG